MTVLLVIVCAVVVFPMYWQFLSVVQPLKYSLSYNPPLFFKAFSLAPFQQLFDQQPMARWLWNTARLSLLVTGICLILSVVGAYVLSHLKWKARPAFGFFILLTQMVPGAIVIVPVYRLYHNLHLLNSLPALGFVQAAFALPICTWILKNAFDAVPGSLVERVTAASAPLTRYSGRTSAGAAALGSALSVLAQPPRSRRRRRSAFTLDEIAATVDEEPGTVQRWADRGLLAEPSTEGEWTRENLDRATLLAFARKRGTDGSGRALKRGQAWLIVKQASERAQVRVMALRASRHGQAGEPAPVHPHLFRHARVRQIVRQTKSLPLAQRQAGWARLQPAYLSIGDEEARQMMRALTE